MTGLQDQQDKEKRAKKKNPVNPDILSKKIAELPVLSLCNYYPLIFQNKIIDKSHLSLYVSIVQKEIKSCSQ